MRIIRSLTSSMAIYCWAHAREDSRLKREQHGNAVTLRWFTKEIAQEQVLCDN